MKSQAATALHKRIRIYAIAALCLTAVITGLAILIPLNHHLSGSDISLIIISISGFTVLQILGLLYLIKPLSNKLLIDNEEIENQIRIKTKVLEHALQKSELMETESKLLQIVTTAITTSKDINEALEITLLKICDATSWAVGDAWLYNPDTNRLEFVCSYHDKNKKFLKKFTDHSKDITFRKGVGLPGKSWQTKNTVWSKNLINEEFFTRQKIAVEAGIKAGLGVPIPLNDEVIAVLCFYLLDELEEDKQFVEIVTAIAGQLGMLLKEKQMEEFLKESELRFRSLVESSPEAIVLSDSLGNIISVNKGAEKMFGYADGELLNKPLTILMPERYREPHTAGLKRYRETGEAHVLGKVIELHGLKKEGKEFPIELSLAKWTSRNELFFSGIIRDVSARKNETKKVEMMVHELREGHKILLNQMEERQAAQVALQRAKDELEERVIERTRELTTMNEELKNFSYIVSHDLKAPLRAIGSLTDMLLADEADKMSEDAKEKFILLKNRVKRMDDLINGILQYSRIGRTELEKTKVDLNELVVGIIQHLGVPKNIEVKIINKLPVIHTELISVSQIFQNLIDNAIKYMDKPQGLITIGSSDKGDYWEFCIKDNGPGIEEQYFEKIFQIFQTLNPRDVKESTGIGLTIVQKIVKRLGGEIDVKSKLNEGSTFTFTLPKDTSKIENPD